MLSLCVRSTACYPSVEADRESLPHHEKRATQLKLPITFSEVKAALNISSINISLLSLQHKTQVLFECHKTRAVAAPQKLRNFRSWQGLSSSPKNLSIKNPYTHTCIYIYLCIYKHICKRSIWIRTQHICLEVYKLYKMCSSPSRWHSYHKLPKQEPYGGCKQALLYRRHHPPER